MQYRTDEATFAMIKGAVSEAVAEAVASVTEHNFLSPEEREWVRMAIKREARQEAFREKIISSTAIGALWAILAGLGGALLIAMREYMVAHGMWRP